MFLKLKFLNSKANHSDTKIQVPRELHNNELSTTFQKNPIMFTFETKQNENLFNVKFLFIDKTNDKKRFL